MSDTRHIPTEADTHIINARDCELAGFDLDAVLEAAKHQAP